MAAKVSLQIHTPKGIFWNADVSIVTVKTMEGYIGLQRNKSPLMAALEIAKLHINESNSKEYRVCAIAGGIVMAEKDSVTIITDSIEFKENIDLERAQRDKKLAEEIIKANKSYEELIRAQMALKKAINRIEVRN